ncbi:PHB depolymerase family esterase [Curvibacter sp. RS43]|uniref:extracellular catalytic domain type 1 short-chain-length polyhydroxyalkanoate depolymerase n=1 Tax=Curvibacter microcysteis TaxID=3026419 RepID=UPI00235FF2C8|nr:PHB depolymerase family esterase [Curvibacter sp. RS43]MDD0809003.1 PHB depolymerase family esterase [Curvibacter sp. RS43]
MKKRLRAARWARAFTRGAMTLARMTSASAGRVLKQARRDAVTPRPGLGVGAGTWRQGLAIGMDGALRYRLYGPPDIKTGERLALMVMLHGCGQDAEGFAMCTGMNRVAAEKRFMVLYPEQDPLSNPQRCWNWFETRHGRAHAEAELILKAIDQVCTLNPVNPQQIAIAGLSAGASMAALLVTRHPSQFKALVMHSGVAPGTAHSTLTAFSAMRGRRPTLPLDATPNDMATDWPALMVIHGDADTTVSPTNAEAAAQNWAQAAAARSGQVHRRQRGQRYAMAVTDFKNRDRLVARLVLVAGLGHAWSGGAANQPFADGRGPDASRLAWTFAAQRFQRPGLPEAAGGF